MRPMALFPLTALKLCSGSTSQRWQSKWRRNRLKLRVEFDPPACHNPDAFHKRPQLLTSTTMSSPAAAAADDDAPAARKQIRLTIPQRFYLLPGAAIVLGVTIGLFRGSRRASLRFLAENVHRPPTTVQGWYFYQKTKNYRVILGGLKEAGADALRLGTTAAGWVCFEEGATRLGEDVENVKEVIAGVGTAGIFSLACEFSVRSHPLLGVRWADSCACADQLPMKATGRTMLLGLLIGCSLRGLRYTQEKLRTHAAERAARLDAAALEGRSEVIEDVKEVAEEVQRKV